MIEIAPGSEPAPPAPVRGSKASKAGRRRPTCRRIEDHGLTDALTRRFQAVFGGEAGEARAYLADEFLLIRIDGLLGPADRSLLESSGGRDSDFIRTMKLRLAENALAGLVLELAGSTGTPFAEKFLSYSPHDDEMMIVLKTPEGEGAR